VQQTVDIGEEVGELEGQLTDFFGAHYDRLVRLAALVCHSQSSVEDAVQSAMEQAWRRRTTLRNPERLKQWLDQIVVREAIRTNRRPWWFHRLQDSDEVERVADGRVDQSAAWISLVEEFRRLPAEQRVALALHLYAGYAIDQTAQLMGAGIETTRSRVRLGRLRLRRELREERL
jgi:RNA polymerase sigma factor (sigma-70 family)